MIGHLVPDDDPHWLNFLLLLTIIDYLFAPVISSFGVDYLRVIIDDHHSSFTELYQSCNIIPKMHLYGLVRVWCMRLEGKHSTLQVALNASKISVKP